MIIGERGRGDMAYRRLQENAKINDLIIGERYAIDDLYIIYGYFFYLDNVRYMESDELGADSGVTVSC